MRLVSVASETHKSDGGNGSLAVVLIGSDGVDAGDRPAMLRA
jgi:hypothetical protein